MPRTRRKNTNVTSERQVPRDNSDASMCSASSIVGSDKEVGKVRGSAVESVDRINELERELSLARETIAELSRVKMDSCERPAPEPEWKPDCGTNSKVTAQPTLSAVHSLPRVELSSFDGNPVDYWKFSRQFECYVESKTDDPGQRLLYLLHYCRGKALKAIDACVMLPPDEGYERARSILKEMYGLPHVVARSLLNELLEEALRVKNNSDSLSNLALRMENCQIALKQMNCESDLNSIGTLEGVVKCLPISMQHQWADTADQLTSDGFEVTFDRLTKFVARRARVARSRFGQLLEKPVSQLTRTGPAPRMGEQAYEKRKVYLTSQEVVKPSIACCICKASHEVRQCPKFLEADIKSRWDMAKRNAICFVCLRRSHSAASCNIRPWCTVKNCGKRHNTLLHYDQVAEKPTAGISCSRVAFSAKVCLGSIPIKVETPNGLIPAIAFLDGGSDTTLILKDFVEQFSMSSSPAEVSLTTLGHQRRLACSRLSFNIHSVDDTEVIHVVDAYTVDKLPHMSQCSLKGLGERFAHLQGIDFPELEDQRVTVLLGCDVPEAHWALEQRLGGRKSPFATRTLLGWVLQGPTAVGSKTSLSICRRDDSKESLDIAIERLYNSEFSDLSAETKGRSRDDDEALKIVGRSDLVNGHYQVPLPWKPDGPKLANDYFMAEKRLMYLRRRFERDKTMFDRYAAVMQHHFEAGFIEKLPRTDYEPCRVWYLPHHPVFNPKKPDKLRVVFDCAAKYMETSLNDALLQGPNLTTHLIDVLLRFRLHVYAVAADIEEMFLQVGVPEDDRDALRILWWENNDMSSPIKEFRMTVHPFGATSSPFCATYALRKTVESFGHLFDKCIGSYVALNFYVDDCLISVPTKDEARLVIDQLTRLLKMAGFRLTKWTANDRELIESIPSNERAPSVRTISEDKLPIERMLGVKWDAATDEFCFDLNLLKRPSTRRSLLSLVSGLYDPLGLMSPWIFPGKELLQRTCKQRLGWDEPMCEDLQLVCDKWLHSMHAIRELRLPRRIGESNDVMTCMDLHIFCDASESGHGAVAYGYLKNESSRSPVRLLFSKSRVNPLKTISIPRLELSAAVLGVRIFLLLKRAYGNLEVNVNFWTDSMIVLYYINNRSSRFSTFVANRLALIHEHTLPNQWRHVSTRLNPADLTSRGVTDLARLTFWLAGPEFLEQPMKMWPEAVVPDCTELAEYKRTTCNLSLTTSDCVLEPLWCYFSSWMKLLRSVAWILRYKRYIMIMFGGQRGISLSVDRLRVSEIRSAELELLRSLQCQAFGLRPCSTDRDELIPNSLRKLRPYFDDGVLRVGGRLRLSCLGTDSAHPFILPKGHHVTNLLIRHYHLLEGHSGPVHTLSVIRRRFWIVNGLASVKRELRHCIRCKRLNARSSTQMMADLPAIRVTNGVRPFAEVGLDYFGPFNVKRGRSLEKRYGCLFTCLQSRAVHIEVAQSMSTDSFMMVLMRFIGRRGSPKTILSDNGSNFIGADRILKTWIKDLDCKRIGDKLMTRGIEWHFNIPYASHRGGVWERLIRSIRRALNGMCTEQTPSDETLSTALVESERILNNRPLVPLSSDDVDASALCPNDLLLCCPNTGVYPDVGFVGRFKFNWKQSLHMVKVFWKRWKAEYLPLLQTRQRWINRRRNFCVGDIVLVGHNDRPKHDWSLGVVDNVCMSDDGLVRSVVVRTKEGVLTRDVRKISLLEGTQEDELRGVDGDSIAGTSLS